MSRRSRRKEGGGGRGGKEGTDLLPPRVRLLEGANEEWI